MLMFFISLSVNQILQFSLMNMRSNYILHFIFFIMLFRDTNWARPSDRLTWEWP